MANQFGNGNTAKKGNFVGTQKKHKKTVTQKQTSKTAPSGSFGQAKTIASGKKNFSRGAPGHASGM